MSNAFWYGLVVLGSIALAIYTFYRVPDKRLIAFYAFLSGFTYAGEFVILVLLNAYRYQPDVMRNAYFDNVLGAIVSDALAVPITAMAVAALDLRLAWMLLLAGVNVALEAWFDYVGVFEHYWWKLSFTGVGFLVWFLIAKVVYARIRSSLTTLIRFGVLFYADLAISASVVFVLAAVFQAGHYEAGWFQDRTRDHVAFATAYILLLAPLQAALVTFHVPWRWRLVALFFLILPVDWLQLRKGILHLSDGWTLYHLFAVRVGTVWLLDLVGRCLLATPVERQPIGTPV